MQISDAILPTPFATWSRRVALFSVQLVLLGIVLHRFMSLPTPVAINLFATALAGAVLAIGIGLIAFIVIWRLGRSGAWSAAAGVLLGLLLLAWPAAYAPVYYSSPALTDVTTDTAVPPRFVALAGQRRKGANSVNYAGERLAKLQAEAYPDLKPVVIPRPATETFEMVDEVVRRLRWEIAAEQPPQGRGKPGYIEALDRTLVLGFYDDVVIRIDGDARESRIDVRSASRYGQHDLGRNAARVRRLFAEIRTQLETGVAGGSRRKRRPPTAAVPKRLKGGPAAATAQTKSPGRPQSGAQRGLQPKEKLRPRGADQGPGKQ